jgi:AAA domain, putative AbiEii toxin, Type IV TA system
LEALSFFSVTHNAANSRLNNALKWSIRYENEAELFFNGKIEDSNFINIETNLAKCKVTYRNFEDLTIEIQEGEVKTEIVLRLDERLGVPSMRTSQPYSNSFKKVKRYTFDHERRGRNMRNRLKFPFLAPPYGSNLMETIEQNKELSEECIGFFKRYDLDLVFDRASNDLKVLKTIKNSENGKEEASRFFLLPYSSVADTLQRVIFYKTAIASNKNSILLFEEPEAHAFPPYIAHITQEIIWSENNQFFLTTHSPFILNDFLEDARQDLAVYLVDWHEGETTVKRLSDDDLHEIYQYGIDLFTNLETFV